MLLYQRIAIIWLSAFCLTIIIYILNERNKRRLRIEREYTYEKYKRKHKDKFN
jgi:hypothetical protein